MTVSRRTILLTVPAALAAVPALPKPAAAGDQVLLDAYARWQDLDRQSGVLDEECQRLCWPAHEAAEALFGFPRDAETQVRYMAWLDARHASDGYHQVYDAFNATLDEWHATLDTIAATPATTPRGALVKAELLQLEVRDGDSDHAGRLIDSLVVDLQRLAGGAS